MLNTTPMKLARDKDGNPKWKQNKTKHAQNVVTPAARPYATSDSTVEAPRGFFGFGDGMGFQREKLNSDVFGYRYGLYIDSSSEYIVNGPAVTAVTPTTTDATNGGQRFFEFTVAGTRKLCCLVGRYVLVRDADTAAGWVVAKDLGVGVIATRVAVFRGSQSGDFAFIAIGTAANYWTWSGASNTTVFAQHSTDKAILFLTIKDYLVKVDKSTAAGSPGYRISKAFDGGATPSFGAPYIMTDLTNPITDAAFFNNRLYLTTEQGIIAPFVDEANDFSFQVEEITPAFKYQRNANNGLGVHAWWQYLFVPMNNSMFNMDTAGNIPEVGLGTLKGNISEVQGTPTAIAGFASRTLFTCFYNAINGHSYLMRWGGHEFVDNTRVFVPGWHGALYKFDTQQINSMIVTEVSGAPRLYMASNTGNIYYIVLPRYSMDWRSDSSCQYNTTNPGEVYFPIIDHGVPFEQKVSLAIAMTTENMTSPANRYISVTYRTDPAESFGNAANIANSGVYDIDPGQRFDFVDTVGSQRIEMKAVLTTATAATPCVIRTIATYQAVRPAFKWMYEFSVLISAGELESWGGGTDRILTNIDLLRAVTGAAASTVTVSLVDPNGDSRSVLVLDLQINQVAGRPGEDNAWYATIIAASRLAQFTPSSAIMELYDYGELEAYTYLQLEALTSNLASSDGGVVTGTGL